MLQRSDARRDLYADFGTSLGSFHLVELDVDVPVFAG